MKALVRVGESGGEGARGCKGGVLGGRESGEGHCCDMSYSRVYPGGSGKDRGDGGRENVRMVGVEGVVLCLEEVGGSVAGEILVVGGSEGWIVGVEGDVLSWEVLGGGGVGMF